MFSTFSKLTKSSILGSSCLFLTSIILLLLIVLHFHLIIVAVWDVFMRSLSTFMELQYFFVLGTYRLVQFVRVMFPFLSYLNPFKLYLSVSENGCWIRVSGSSCDGQSYACCNKPNATFVCQNFVFMYNYTLE